MAVPYVHVPLTKFEKGVPTTQVRELLAGEKAWGSWSTSPIQYNRPPGASAIAHVKEGEVWVVERRGSFSRLLQQGSHLFLPLLDSLKTVKSPLTVVSGVVLREAATKQGSPVDVYAVAYFTVSDPVKSAYYVDPESNTADSEYALAKAIRKALAKEIAQSESSELSEADKTRIADNIKKALKKKEDLFGISVSGIEVRGAFPTDLNVPDKIRAMDPPEPSPDAPGHNLAPDYWAELLSPPYFEKKTFGSLKEPKTPASVSLEWSVPSPPDYHHFNQVPKMTVSPSFAKELEKSH